jgi:hypothetical protein
MDEPLIKKKNPTRIHPLTQQQLGAERQTGGMKMSNGWGGVSRSGMGDEAEAESGWVCDEGFVVDGAAGCEGGEGG